MNYMTGIMLGTSLIQGLRSMFGGDASPMGGMRMGGGKGMGMTSAMGMMGSGVGGMAMNTGMGRGRNSNQTFSLPEMFDSKVNEMSPYPAPPPKGELKLISDISGRRRYRTHPFSKELADLIETNVSKLKYVKTVEVTSETGSILLTFDEDEKAKIDKLASWLKDHLFTENYATMKRDRKLNRIIYGSITRSIKKTVRKISDIIIRETHGVFDLRSLGSLIFGVLGFRKMMLTGQFPSGVQMIWWAVSLMRGVKIS